MQVSFGAVQKRIADFSAFILHQNARGLVGNQEIVVLVHGREERFGAQIVA